MISAPNGDHMGRVLENENHSHRAGDGVRCYPSVTCGRMLLVGNLWVVDKSVDKFLGLSIASASETSMLTS